MLACVPGSYGPGKGATKFPTHLNGARDLHVGREEEGRPVRHRDGLGHGSAPGPHQQGGHSPGPAHPAAAELGLLPGWRAAAGGGPPEDHRPHQGRGARRPGDRRRHPAPGRGGGPGRCGPLLHGHRRPHREAAQDGRGQLLARRPGPGALPRAGAGAGGALPQGPRRGGRGQDLGRERRGRGAGHQPQEARPRGDRADAGAAGRGHRAGGVASPTPATWRTSSPPTSTCPSRRSRRSSRRSTSRRG